MIENVLRPPMDPRCGRLKALDKGDLGYPLMAAFAPGEIPEEKMWQMYGKYLLDQGYTPRCVGFGQSHSIAAAPVLHPVLEDVAAEIYDVAQQMDEWPGENYDGTSVRAGFKAAIFLGHAKGPYRWAQSESDVHLWIRSHGAVNAGTEWLEGMLDTDEAGYVHLTGGSVGGHAWVIIGYDKERDAYRGLNSWGRKWGQDGRFWIKRDDYRVLHERLGGEAGVLTEK